MKNKFFYTLLSVFLWIAFFIVPISGQETSSDDPDLPSFEELWNNISEQIDTEKEDSLAIIRPLVEEYCQGNYDCIYDTYYKIMLQYENKQFNLFPAIYICKLMLQLSKKEQNDLNIASCYRNICRYSDALGYHEVATLHIDSAIVVYERIGDQNNLFNAQFYRMERILYAGVDVDTIFSQMDSLLNVTKNSGDPELYYSFLRQVVSPKITFGRHDEAEAHLIETEPLLFDSTINRTKDDIMEFHRQRGFLYRHQNKLEESKSNFLKGLYIAREISSIWRELDITNQLADVTWKLQDNSLAKSYLDTAITKASEKNLHDLLIVAYGTKAQIAESEENYKETLFATRKMEEYQAKARAKTEGFDIKNHYLKVENEKLAAVQRSKDLELSNRRNQVRSFIIIGLLLLLLAISAIIAYVNQRRRRKILTEQNVLIQEQAEQLANLDKAKSRFFANVSHELRTPLTLIQGPLESVLQEGHFDKKNQALLETAHKSSQKLLQLVSSILDLSKIESNKLELYEQTENFHPLLTRIVYSFESLAATRKINLTMDYSLDKELYIMLDKEKFETILYNYLSNALKYTPAQGKVHVSAKEVEGNIHISVQDSGRGIHPDDIPHIFDRFFQSKQANAPVEGGTGIGLALAAELVQLMGGEVSVESEVQKGSTFSLQIPMNIQEGQETTATQKTTTASIIHEAEDIPLVLPKAATNGSRPRLLVVEDNTALREYIVSVLEPYYHITVAENGQMALDSLALQSNINLILSDIMMPVMDGFQLLDNLKSDKKYRHIPVVMLTARADIKDKLKALRIGVDDYLLKPFVNDELLVRIQNLLDNHTVRQLAIQEDSSSDKTPNSISDEDQEWLETFENYVRQHLGDSLLSIPSLISEFAMSESSLLRQVKRLTGLSPIKYIQEMRLNQARELLENQSQLSISQIAAKVGYPDSPNFTRNFKKRFGKTPSAFLSQYHP